MTEHKIKAYTTWEGYGIQCTCDRRWEWDMSSDFTLDEMAAEARSHAENVEVKS